MQRKTLTDLQKGGAKCKSVDLFCKKRAKVLTNLSNESAGYGGFAESNPHFWQPYY